MVHEHGIEDLHSCQVDIDNTGYACGAEDNHMVCVFNRLVDTDEISEIIVNEVSFPIG